MAADAVDTFQRIALLVFKWILIATVGVVILIALTFGVIASHTWYVEGRHVAKLDVVVNLSKDGICKTDDYPIFVGIINNSERTLEKFKFTLAARHKNRSTNIAEYHSFTDDHIIKPKEGIGHCWSPPKLREAISDLRSLDWSFEYKSFYFAD